MIHHRGFTLIEILIVIAILTILIASATTVDFGDFRKSSFNDTRNLILLSLQKSRSNAMNTICTGTSCTTGSAHGIRIETTRYIIFQGSTYNSIDPTNEIVYLPENTRLRGMTEIIFEKLTGNTRTTPAGTQDLVLYDSSSHISTTTIGNEGQISWTQ